ncbi:hypothetical protein GE09DRAFT_557125 [Coniochaeta sp. 2T2.1]|nr:hypothetical protein GE09DRAFT_557125 [Coniochaeta sp. 2T2.1]
MVTTPGHGSLGGPATNKITKAKGKVVKPILKKLSYSEKDSLDLDRGWEDQQVVHSIGGGDAGLWEPFGTGRTAKDVSFSFGAGARGSSGGRSALSGKEGVAGTISSSSGSHGGANVVRKTYQSHGRSHSGASVATTGSGSGGGGLRSGSFVHPFQQMPQTSTPPLSYANSLASFDNSSVHGGGGTGGARDYSPTITETEDDDGDGNGSTSTSLRPQLHLNSTLNSTNSNTGLHNNLIHHHSHHPSLQSTHSSTFSQTGLRRPSLASQRTSSLTDITSALTTSTTSPQLRVSTNNTTGRSTPTKTSRLAPSKSDLHLNLTLSDLESPVGSILGATPVLASVATAPPAVATPTSSVTTTTPMSPLRTSLEAMGRLRSRSEVDTATRQEQIRQARRKFEERERAKEAKYEREEVERRNRQANKEASRIEKETREWYKATGVSSGGSGGGAGSLNGSSVNVNMLGLHGLGGSESGRPKIPAAAVTKGASYSSGRPSISRKTSPTSIAASASVPIPGLLGKKRKGSFGITAGTPGGGAGSSRPDFTNTSGYASNGSSSRKNSGGFTTTTLGRDRQANLEDVEKGPSAFAASNYDTLPEDASRMPRFGASIDDDGQRAHNKHRPRRSSNLKKETQTFWQGFVLWLRTRVFKLKRKAQR